MYEEFFGMTKTPFMRGMAVSELYSDRETTEVQSRLEYAARKQLFAVLVGESGCGKTTALRRLKESLEKSEYILLYLSDSKLTPRHFYNGLLEQLGCEGKYYRGDSRRLLHKQIEIVRGMQGRKIVAVVDEGHLLSKEMLEEVRFLLNYKMDSENPLSLIISGQWELWDKLHKPDYSAIMQRIEVLCRLNTYDLAQTMAYITRQLEYANVHSPLFTEAAIEEIQEYTKGLPRQINRVCSQSLMYAYQTKRRIVDDRMVRDVIESEVN